MKHENQYRRRKGEYIAQSVLASIDNRAVFDRDYLDILSVLL